MDYKGKYTIFNQNLIKNHFAKRDSKKVSFNNLLKPSNIDEHCFKIDKKAMHNIIKIAENITLSRKNNKPVILFMGAHLIKNGLGLLLIDLIKKGIVTLVAGNCATAIHDFELAMIGQTSEDVPLALKDGKFGMTVEFGIMNYAIKLGNRYRLGLGETLGRMICEKAYYDEILEIANIKEVAGKFEHPQASVLATCYKNKIPFTIHVGIGTDVIDQHSSFDGCSKGGCSGRDFLIFVQEVTKLVNGGVFLNIGSAVMGPEVFLKAVSMAANSKMPPSKIMTANFDLREEAPSKNVNEYSQYYYFRDQKSIISRIPRIFNGNSFYVKGDQRNTIPLLYKELIKKFDLNLFI